MQDVQVKLVNNQILSAEKTVVLRQWCLNTIFLLQITGWVRNTFPLYGKALMSV